MTDNRTYLQRHYDEQEAINIRQETVRAEQDERWRKMLAGMLAIHAPRLPD